MKEYFKKSKSFVALVLAVLVAFTMTPVQGVQAAVSAKATTYTVSGTITGNDTNKAVRNATVTLKRGTLVKTAKTDAYGKYSITGVAKATGYTLSVAATTYSTYNFPTFSVAANVAKNYKLATTKTFTVSGVIKNKLGKPVSGATVAIKGATSKSVKTTSTGAYSLTGVKFGTGYTLTVTGTNYTPYTFPKFDLKANATKNYNTLAPLFRVAGTITDATTKKPVANAKVVLKQGTAVKKQGVTSATGAYSLTGVAIGSNYTVEITATGYTKKVISAFAITNANVTKSTTIAKVVTAYTVSGTITDDTTKAPVAGAKVSLKQGTAVKKSGTTTATGAYSFTGVPAGSNYTVEITATDYTTKVIPAFAVTTANVVKSTTLTKAVAAKYTVSGTVKDKATTDLVVGASVKLMDGTTQVGTTQVTTATGTYSFADVPAKDGYTVVVTAENYTDYTSAAFNVSAATTQNVELEKTAVYTISGKVTDKKSPTTVLAATLQLKNKVGANVGSEVQATETGTYTITNVPAGEGYTIEVTMTGYEKVITTTFDVTSANITDKDITLDKTYNAAEILSLSVVSKNALMITTADTTGKTIAKDDFTVSVDGVAISSFSVTKNSATSYTLLLTSSLTAGQEVSLTGALDLKGTKTGSYYAGKISGKATGYVKTDDALAVSKGVEGVTVTLRNAIGVVIKEQVTDANGLYNLYSVDNGTYSIQFIKDGFSSSLDNSTLTGVTVTTDDNALTKDKTLVSTSTALQSTGESIAIVDNATKTIKVTQDKTVNDVKGVIWSEFNAVGTGAANNTSIKILTSATNTTEVANSSVVSSTNVIQSISPDTLVKQIYTISVIESSEMAIYGVKLAKGTKVGTTKITSAPTDSKYKVGTATEVTIPSNGTADDVTVKVGDVITVWTGTDATLAGKSITFTVKATNIQGPTVVGVQANSEAKSGGVLKNITAINSMTGLEMYVSSASTTADFTVSGATKLDYLETSTALKLPSTVTTEGSYYLYLLHTASGAVSEPSTAFKIDNRAPVLTFDAAKAVTRTAADAGTISFKSNELITAGTGYGYFVSFDASVYPTISDTDIASDTGGNIISTSLDTVALSGASAWSNISTAGLVKAITGEGAAKATVIAVDKAGNRSNELHIDINAFVDLIPVVGNDSGVYTVRLKADADSVLDTAGEIAYNSTSTAIRLRTTTGGLKTYPSNSPNYAMFKGLLDGLTDGDTFTLNYTPTTGNVNYGKITAITKTSTATDLAVTLDAANCAATLTVKGSTTGLLKIKGTAGSTNLSIDAAGAAADLYDFSELTFGATGKITNTTEVRTVSIPVAKDTTISFADASTFIANHVTFAVGAATNVKVIAVDSYEVAGQASTLGIDVSGATGTANHITMPISVKLTSGYALTGAITLTGSPDHKLTVTTRVSDPITNVAAIIDAVGGIIDITGVDTYAVINVATADLATTTLDATIAHGVTGALNLGKATTYSTYTPAADSIAKISFSKNDFTLVSGTVTHAYTAGGTPFSVPASKKYVIKSGAKLTSTSFAGAFSAGSGATLGKLVVEGGATCNNGVNFIGPASIDPIFALSGGQLEFTSTAAGFTATIKDDAKVEIKDNYEMGLGTGTHPGAASDHVIVNGATAQLIIPKDSVLIAHRDSTVTVTTGELVVNGTLLLRETSGSNTAAIKVQDGAKLTVGQTGKLGIYDSTNTTDHTGPSLAFSSGAVVSINNTITETDATLNITPALFSNTFYNSANQSAIASASSLAGKTFKWKQNAGGADIAGWKAQ